MFRPAENPVSRYQETWVDWLEEAPEARLEILEDDTKSILARNNSPDVPFSWGVNPYRGCQHACAYCYARPSHEYLGMGAGTDFETKILVKRRAPELLRKAFMRPSWKGEVVAFSGNTDCYQPIEAKLGITRACLEVCREFRNPVGILTRSAVIERDLDLLEALNEVTRLTVSVSIPMLDTKIARVIEPGAPSPKRRLQTIAALSERGIPVGVSLAPVIPGISDRDIPKTLQLAREAGARWAWMLFLRLPGAVAEVFESRLQAGLPERVDTIMNRVRRARGGELNDSRMGHRMRGTGESWETTERLFSIWRDRLGFEGPPPPAEPSPFRRPDPNGQLSLFGD